MSLLVIAFSMADEHRPVPRLDDDEVRIRRADAGQLVQRRLRTVVVDDDALHQRGRGATGADSGEVALHGLDGTLHLRLDRRQRLVRHGRSVS